MKKRNKQVWITAAACAAAVVIVGVVTGSAIWSVTNYRDAQNRGLELAEADHGSAETVRHTEAYENVVTGTRAASRGSSIGEKSVYGIQNVNVSLPAEESEAAAPVLEPPVEPQKETQQPVSPVLPSVQPSAASGQEAAAPEIVIASGQGPEVSAAETQVPESKEVSDPESAGPESSKIVTGKVEEEAAEIAVNPETTEPAAETTSESPADIQAEPESTAAAGEEAHPGDRGQEILTEHPAEVTTGEQTPAEAIVEPAPESASEQPAAVTVPEPVQPEPETVPVSEAVIPEPSTEGTTAHGDHHIYEEIILEAPSCIHPGLARYVCRICNGYYEAILPETGEHSWVLVSTDPNVYSCTVCGAEYTE